MREGTRWRRAAVPLASRLAGTEKNGFPTLTAVESLLLE